MKARLARLGRPFVLTILTGAVLILSFGSRAWASSPQHAAGQTIPIASPTSGSGGGNPKNPTTPPAATTPPGATTAPAPTTEPASVVLPATPGGCVATLGPGGAGEAGTVVVVDVPIGSLPSQPPQYVYVSACEVIFTNAAGVVVPGYVFATPVEVCLPYTDADLARAGNNPGALVIITYDPQTGQPIELPYTIDPVNKKVCGKLSRAGIVVLAIRAPRAVSLPNTGGELLNEAGDAAQAVPLPSAPRGAASPAPGGALQWSLVAIFVTVLGALVLALSRRTIGSGRDEQ